MTVFPTLSYTSTSEIPPLSSIIPEAWKSSPFGRSLPVKAIIGSTPRGAFHYLKENLHVSTMNDIQLLKIYRLGSKSDLWGEQEHPRLEGMRIQKFFNRKKTWDRGFPAS